MNKTKKKDVGGQVPANFRRVMVERKRKYGIPHRKMLALALDFALKNRDQWDPFFVK